MHVLDVESNMCDAMGVQVWVHRPTVVSLGALWVRMRVSPIP